MSWLSLSPVNPVIPVLVAGLWISSAPGQTRLPQTPTLQESVSGRDSFAFYCASCHGVSGKGDGPIASALKARPADLTALAQRSGGRFPRDRVVGFVEGTGRALPAHGPTEMPVWGPLFRAFDPSDARVRVRIDNLVNFVESLQAPSTAPGDIGSRLFRTHCANCHGTDARGDGPFADSLRRTPPDLTKFTMRNGGVFPSERVYQIIDGRTIPSHGNREMPIWGDAFTNAREGGSAESAKTRIDALVRYLMSIQVRPAE